MGGGFASPATLIFPIIWLSLLDLFFYEFIQFVGVAMFIAKMDVVRISTYCTFDLSWQPGPWKSRILLDSLTDYCRPGQKNKKSHLGHSLMIIIGWDMIDHSLYILLESHSSVCRLLSNLIFELLRSVTYVYLCARAPCVDESWQRTNKMTTSDWHVIDDIIKISKSSSKNNHNSLIAPPSNWGRFVLSFYPCNWLHFW